VGQPILAAAGFQPASLSLDDQLPNPAAGPISQHVPRRMFNRVGTVAAPLEVRFTLGGSQRSVTIPAGRTSARVTVLPGDQQMVRKQGEANLEAHKLIKHPFSPPP
jgi:hypothetical protein